MVPASTMTLSHRQNYNSFCPCGTGHHHSRAKKMTLLCWQSDCGEQILDVDILSVTMEVLLSRFDTNTCISHLPHTGRTEEIAAMS
jgi:hypothetical protein